MSENLFFSRDTKVFIGLDKIKALRIQTRGVAYTQPPTLAFSGGGGSGAAATAVIGVSTATVTAGGSGYSSTPTVAVNGGGGSGAVLTATVASGAITAFNIVERGTGYTSVPTIAISGGGGSSGAGTIVLGVADVTVTNEGSGYTSTPTVTVNGGGSPSTTAVIRAGAGIWEIPVLDGFSVSQGTNTSEITLNEASDTSGNSLRGRQMFTDSYAPAEWSFSTYARPFIASGTVAGGGADNVARHHAVEEVLWALMAGNAAYVAPVDGNQNTFWEQGLHNTLASPNNNVQFIDFVDTNKTDLGTCQIFFNLGESSTESKILALPTHSDSNKLTTGGTLVGGSVVTILSLGTTSQADLRTLFGESDGSVTYAVGQKVTDAATNRTIPAGNTVLALSAGASNARLFLPDVTGIEVGDVISFSHNASTRTVLEIDPANDGGLNDFQFVQMSSALVVPDETVVTFSRRITYKVEECCVNEASIDFDIDGIATINWSGLGKLITEAATPAPTVFEGTTSTSNMIRNRLTSMTLLAADHTTFPGDSDGDGTYNLVLTGGNVTISNNMTYLTPETTGMVNQPLEHVTGTRSIAGNFTTYLDKTVGGSADLFEDIIEATTSVTNSFASTFHIGGVAAAPGLKLTMANCHLEVPTHSLDDVIGLEVNFHALPSTISGTDELTVAYKGA